MQDYQALNFENYRESMKAHFHTRFRSRGHFANYIRKIISSECTSYSRKEINLAIWHVWENKALMEAFVKELKAITFTGNRKSFNDRLKKLSTRYRGFTQDGTLQPHSQLCSLCSLNKITSNHLCDSCLTFIQNN